MRPILGRKLGWLGSPFRQSVVLLALTVMAPGAGRTALLSGASLSRSVICAGTWVPPLLRQRTLATPAARSSPRFSYYRTRSGDTYWSIARRRGLDVRVLMSTNSWYDPERLPVEVYLRLPPSPPSPPSARPVRTRTHLHWPISGQITSRYGWRWGRMHQGIDIAAPVGAIVHAAAPGRVVFAGWRSGYGLLVTVAHGQGWSTSYAHNSRLLVRPGQRVDSGTALARVGATGNATGVHLHFEVTTPRGSVDPLGVLP